MRSFPCLSLVLLFVGACSIAPSTGVIDAAAQTDASPVDAMSDADASGNDAPAEAFAITSIEFAEGDMFAKELTCDAAPATMVSPPLKWTAGPSGTQSYAVVFNDTSISFLHGATYDIPMTTFALPKGVQRAYEPLDPSGARQTKAYDGSYGYAGPCPPTGEHVYEFVLYALDVTRLPDVTQDTTTKAVEAEIRKHALKAVRLTGKYKR